MLEMLSSILTIPDCLNPTGARIHNAGGTSNYMVDLFERTQDLHDDTRPAWHTFLIKMQVGKDPEDWYAYPQFRKKMEAEGMWHSAPQLRPPRRLQRGLERGNAVA